MTTVAVLITASTIEKVAQVPNIAAQVEKDKAVGTQMVQEALEKCFNGATSATEKDTTCRAPKKQDPAEIWPIIKPEDKADFNAKYYAHEAQEILDAANQKRLPVSLTKKAYSQLDTFKPKKGSKWCVSYVARTKTLKPNGKYATLDEETRETCDSKVEAETRRDTLAEIWILNTKGSLLVPTGPRRTNDEQQAIADELFAVRGYSAADIKLLLERMDLYKKAGVSDHDMDDFLAAVRDSKIKCPLKEFVRTAVVIGYKGDALTVQSFEEALCNFYNFKIADSFLNQRKDPIGSSHARTYLNIMGHLMADFSEIRPDQWTDEIILGWVNYDHKREMITWKTDCAKAEKEGTAPPKEPVPKVQMKRLAILNEDGQLIGFEKVAVPCRVKYPHSEASAMSIQLNCAAIKNGFALLGYTIPSKIRQVPLSDKYIKARDERNRAFIINNEINEYQAVLDSSYTTQGGRGCAGFIKQVLMGWRRGDTLEVANYIEKIARARACRGDTKTGRPKDELVYPVVGHLLAFLSDKVNPLDGKKLLSDENFDSWDAETYAGRKLRAEIYYNSGLFWNRGWRKAFGLGTDEEVATRPNRLPPKNCPRRTGIGAKWQAVKNVDALLQWAGTGLHSFDYCYSVIMDNDVARSILTSILSVMRSDPFYTEEVINDMLPANHRLDEQLTEKQLEDLKKPREIAARLNVEDAKMAAEKAEAEKAALQAKVDVAAAELELVPITDEFSADDKERCNRIRAALIKSDGSISGAAMALGLKYAAFRVEIMKSPELFEKYAKNGKCAGKRLLWLKPDASKPANGELSSPAVSAV
jgi:hypothetical protein